MSETSQTGILSPETPLLIVDDSIQFATILAKLLKATCGYTNITQATSVKQAISLLSADSSSIQLLFVDYRFPNGETGLQLLDWMFAQEKTGSIVVFLITSEPTPEIISRVHACGGYGVIAKPVERGELKKQLEKVEALRKAEDKEYF